MKLFTNDLQQLLNHIANNTIKALLLYGPDAGFINLICDAIEQKFDFLKVNISYSNLHVESLSLQLNTKNFFSKRQLFQIKGVSGAFDQQIKTMLSGEISHFPIFIGEEIAASSGIRKFFENENYLAAIGCYYDEKNTDKLINSKLKNWLINYEAKQYLKTNLTGDYQHIQNELEKLALYAEANKLKEITLDIVMAVISINSLYQGDDMCTFFASQQAEQFLAAADKIINQTSFNEVTAIRALLRYYLNIYIVNSRVDQGESLDIAIKTLAPPIFFKNLNSFKKAALNTSTAEAVRIISILQNAEKNFKSQVQAFDLFNQIYLPAHLTFSSSIL